MEIAITYYKDIPLEKEGYAEMLGKTIIEQFANDDVDKITFVKFNKLEYAKWLGKSSDTQDKRAEWATYKSSPSKTLSEKNRVEKSCEICGVLFEASKKAKFCSNKCRQKNKNLKNRNALE